MVSVLPARPATPSAEVVGRDRTDTMFRVMAESVVSVQHHDVGATDTDQNGLPEPLSPEMRMAWSRWSWFMLLKARPAT
jgi:hypothetical protein